MELIGRFCSSQATKFIEYEEEKASSETSLSENIPEEQNAQQIES